MLQERAASHLRLEIVLRESGLNTPRLDQSDPTQLADLLQQLEGLPPLTAGDTSLVDGHWIMQRTGLGKGIVLGRLKLWLHRLQIERNLGNVEAVESVLCSLNWQHENHEGWPKVEF